MPPRLDPAAWAQARREQSLAAERVRFRQFNPKVLAQTWSAFSSRESTARDRREAFHLSQELSWSAQLRPHALPKYNRVDRPRRGLIDPTSLQSLFSQ